jgi:hypothetical protein
MIGHEEGVELAGFELLRETLQMSEVEIGIRVGAGLAPGAGMDADRAHEGAEMKLAGSGHGAACREGLERLTI